jgi:hypothetical protein
MILLGILAVTLIIACVSVTALAWIMIGAEVEERKRRKKNEKPSEED